jgi:hypothetical protein
MLWPLEDEAPPQVAETNQRCPRRHIILANSRTGTNPLDLHSHMSFFPVFS